MPEIEIQSDVGDKGSAQLAKFVKLQLKMADKEEREWRLDADRIERIYRGEPSSGTRRARRGGKANSGEARAVHRMNILWSNTEILKPAIYQGTPKPDIRRRNVSKVGVPPDPQQKTARGTAMVLERAVEYSLDQYSFDDEIELDVLDSLLPGRGVSRIRYIPTFSKDQEEFEVTQAPADLEFGISERFFNGDQEIDEGQVQQRGDGSLFGITEAEDLVYEECRIEHVPWDDYRQAPAKRWKDVWWVAFRHLMTRKQLTTEFPGKGKAVKLDWEPKGLKDEDREDQHDDAFKRAEVWEFWDRRKRQVIYVAVGHKEALRVDEDPLSLTDFFPNPEPLLSMKTGRTLVPVPEYTLYEDQANELDRMTARIDLIVKELKVRGVYDSAMTQVKQLLKEGADNRLVGIDNWQRFVEKGGLDGVVDWLPIDRFAEVLTVLYAQRAAVIQQIYELTGISDIFRGSTDPKETKGAQQLKAQFGSLRLKPRQARVARYVRDIFRIKAEVIAEQFSRETVALMTGLEVSDEMMQLMRDEGQRGFSIDVESDTTVAPDEQKDKQEIVEFLAALGGFAQAAAASGLPPEISAAFALWASRRFKVSREVEELLEAFAAGQAGGGGQGQQGAGEAPDPSKMAKVQADTAAKAGEQKLKGREIQVEAQDNIADQDLERDKLSLERDRFEHEKRKWEDEVDLREREIRARNSAPAQAAE